MFDSSWVYSRIIIVKIINGTNVIYTVFGLYRFYCKCVREVVYYSKEMIGTIGPFMNGDVEIVYGSRGVQCVVSEMAFDNEIGRC